jgi:uncharacterized repeat protein (TIGR01451 family)
VRLRGLLLHLWVLAVVAACAGGSGRQGTQIVVSGVGPAAPVAAGANAVFVMTVTNTGPYDASNIKLVDNVGNQLKLISITCSASGGATCPATPTVEMTIPSLPNGGALIFSVTVQLDNNATGTIENAMVANFANEIDPTAETAAATATAFSVITNVVVGGTGPTGTLVGGDTAVFVMTVTNNGPDAATNFNLRDTAGNGLSPVSITCAASGGAVCPATVGILMTVDSLPSGGVLTFTVTTQIALNANGTVSNELAAELPTNPIQSANTFYATATVVSADLAVSGTAPAGPVLGGAAAAFTMVVTNNGPGTAQNISISNALSAGITASGAITCAASAGAVCPTTVGPTMTLASMPAAGVLTFTVPFTVNAGTSGQVTDTLTVSSTTDPRGNQKATVGVSTGSSDLIVTETGTPQVPAADGNYAVFTAVVSNTGPSIANNVTVSYVLSGPAGNVATVTCSAAAATACPTTLGPVMTVPSLGVGRSLTFTFTVPVGTNLAGKGAIVNTVTVSAPGNTDTTESTASYSTNPINPINGTYQLFAANGEQYTMTVNIDALTYTIIGNGLTIPIQRSFTPVLQPGGSIEYLVSGAVQFNAATNAIVGGEDFGTGVLPYLAARVFGTTVEQLAGTVGGLYDFVTLNIPNGGGAAVTTAGTARVSGNTLSICQWPGQVAIPQNCGTSLPNGALQNYALRVDGNDYSGINTVTGQSLAYSFQLAIIGATSALVSAQTLPDGSQQLLLGIPDAAAVAGGLTRGASTSHDWVTVTLSPNNYSFVGLAPASVSDSAPLQRIFANAAPFSMLVGNLASNGATIYVMQSFPLTIAFGENNGAADGLLQVTIP